MGTARAGQAGGFQMTRRKSRSYRIKIGAEAFDRIAAALIGNHRELLDEGWSICPTSGLWRTGKGLLTARVAYRMRARKASLVHTVRGINPGLHDE